MRKNENEKGKNERKNSITCKCLFPAVLINTEWGNKNYTVCYKFSNLLTQYFDITSERTETIISNRFI